VCYGSYGGKNESKEIIDYFGLVIWATALLLAWSSFACPLSWLGAVSVVMKYSGVVEMPSAFTIEECAKVSFVYGFSYGNIMATVVEYRQRYTEL
jgi:apolipoprotein N-acyltransferase